MKATLTYTLFICILLGCGKKPPAPEVEENVVFELNASQAAISTNSNYDFKLTMRSKLPKAGIRIELSATEEAGGAAVTPQPAPVTTTAATADLSVQNLPRQKWVIATVKVTSVSTSTNTSTQTFRVVYK